MWLLITSMAVVLAALVCAAARHGLRQRLLGTLGPACAGALQKLFLRLIRQCIKVCELFRVGLGLGALATPVPNHRRSEQQACVCSDKRVREKRPRGGGSKPARSRPSSAHAYVRGGVVTHLPARRTACACLLHITCTIVSVKRVSMLTVILYLGSGRTKIRDASGTTVRI